VADLEELMKPGVRSLTLKGFRSFALERVELSDLTFLVGPNGAGKSNLVDALALLQEASTHPLSQAIENRGGLDALAYQPETKGKTNGFGLRVDLAGTGLTSAHYSFEVHPHREHSFEVASEQCYVNSTEGEFWFHRERKDFRSNVAGLLPLLDPQFLALPLIGGTRQFLPVYKILTWMAVYKLGVEPLRQTRKAEANDRLAADWSNAANVLQHLAEKHPRAVERISEILSAVTPAKLRVMPRIQGGMVSIAFEQERSDSSHVTFDAVNMSDGTLRILGLLLAVFQRTSRTLLIFEEPDANLHPGALSVVSDLLEEASRKKQVLVTTHSPELLDAKWIKPENLRVVYWENDASRISPVGKASREALQEHLMGAGELLRANVLDTPPLHRTPPEQQLFGTFP
jgi:predicted ATPase